MAAMQPRPGGGDRLAVDVVLYVAAGEDALDGCPGAVAGDDVAVVVEVELTDEEVGVGVVADGHEDAADRRSFDVSPVTVSRRARPRPCRSPMTSSTALFHTKLILGLAKARSCMIFEARSSSRRWTSVTLVAKLVRKLASSMAESPPPTTAISWSRKKKPSQVAQVETPWPRRRALGVEAEHAGRGAGGDDHRPGPVTPRPSAHTPNGAAEKSTRLGVGGDELGPEPGRLGPELLHQLGAHDPVGEPGVVLDVGGQHELAPGAAGNHPRCTSGFEIGPGGVDGGGEARRAGPDDDDVADAFVHGGVRLLCG